VSSRERPVDRGTRRGRQLLDSVVREFHEARLGAGVTQRRIGDAIDRSDAWVSWTESGANESLSVVDASRMLACVGLDLSVRTYPAGKGIRDAAQLALIASLKSRVRASWDWRTEVPLPLPGDPRAWDVVLRGPTVAIGVEAESRLRDIQALDRRVMLKLRDGELDRVVILVAATRTNRTVIRDIADSIRSNYPVPSRQALDALVHGRDPGGNAIVVLHRAPVSAATTA
jgi:hypothetical protein